jgi:hypothetical protein
MQQTAWTSARPLRSWTPHLKSPQTTRGASITRSARETSCSALSASTTFLPPRRTRHSSSRPMPIASGTWASSRRGTTSTTRRSAAGSQTGTVPPLTPSSPTPCARLAQPNMIPPTPPTAPRSCTPSSSAKSSTCCRKCGSSSQMSRACKIARRPTRSSSVLPQKRISATMSIRGTLATSSSRASTVRTSRPASWGRSSISAVVKACSRGASASMFVTPGAACVAL